MHETVENTNSFENIMAMSQSYTKNAYPKLCQECRIRVQKHHRCRRQFQFLYHLDTSRVCAMKREELGNPFSSRNLIGRADTRLFLMIERTR